MKPVLCKNPMSTLSALITRSISENQLGNNFKIKDRVVEPDYVRMIELKLWDYGIYTCKTHMLDFTFWGIFLGQYLITFW